MDESIRRRTDADAPRTNEQDVVTRRPGVARLAESYRRQGMEESAARTRAKSELTEGRQQ